MRELLTIAILIIAGWYLISEMLTWMLCWLLNVRIEESDELQDLRAGMFLMPVMVAMLMITWLNWKVYQWLCVMIPIFPAPSDNPFDGL